MLDLSQGCVLLLHFLVSNKSHFFQLTTKLSVGDLVTDIVFGKEFLPREA